MYEYHDALVAGHPGVRRTLHTLQRYFFWPTMKSDVTRYVRMCPTCQRVKARKHKKYGRHVGTQPTARRWENVSFDFITDLPLTANGNNAIHVIMDETSRRIRLDACNMHITAEETGDLIFNSLVRNHGLPRKIISDRDTRFTSKIWKYICFSCFASIDSLHLKGISTHKTS